MPNRRKIFIVDDDAMFSEMLRDHLAKNSTYDLQIFNTGEDCLKQLQSKPDVIILDYYLNSVSKNAANGMQILESIKKQAPNVHVVMLSSQERYGIALQTITKGAEQYVLKGKDAFEEINSIIQQLE